MSVVRNELRVEVLLTGLTIALVREGDQSSHIVGQAVGVINKRLQVTVADIYQEVLVLLGMVLGDVVDGDLFGGVEGDSLLDEEISWLALGAGVQEVS